MAEHITSKDELIVLLKSLGVRSPEEWVQYLPDEPSTVIARYIFLKQAWDSVAVEGKTEWIDKEVVRSKEYPDEPYAGLGIVLQRMLHAGIDREDITEFARCLQAGMLFRVGYLLDGRAYPIKGWEHIDWALFRTDADGKPTEQQIAGLHESVLSTDPTGREMRPPNSTKKT